MERTCTMNVLHKAKTTKGEWMTGIPINGFFGKTEIDKKTLCKFTTVTDSREQFLFVNDTFSDDFNNRYKIVVVAGSMFAIQMNKSETNKRNPFPVEALLNEETVSYIERRCIYSGNLLD